MSSVTQCPQCGTRFKASQVQLEAHQGMVRCGRCHTAFNAMAHLHDEELSPQLDLPIELEEILPELPPPQPLTTLRDTADVSEPKPMAQMIPMRKRRTWAWTATCVLLLIFFFGQALYFFRVEISARLPGIKPMLLAYCVMLRCSVPLPRNADFLTIESSTLEADPAQANVIILRAILRNHAPYVQAYPNLELTLNDVNDRPVARRSFRPVDYLGSGENEQNGLLPNRDFSVRINLDTSDLPAAGYRLLLSYPK